MTKVPYGAIRTVEEVEALIKKAPVIIYRIDLSYSRNIMKREIRGNSKILDHGWVTYTQPETGFLGMTGFDLNSDCVFVFTNYWLAWAYSKSGH